jgi:carbamoyl-phosphate synthase large subunit
MVICALKIGGKRSFGSAAVYAPKLNLTLKVPKTLINQCFLTENREIVFLEINPRVGGGVPLTFKAGINYGKYLEKFANGYIHSKGICEFEELAMMRYDMAVYE